MHYTPNTANQAVAAFLAQATPATFAARVGGSTATPNALGYAVCTGYTGHSRLFSNVRGNMRAAGYRANPRWPALTCPQWQAVYNVQPALASKATAKQQQGARGKLGKVLASAAKAQGAPAPRSILPPLAATRTQGARQGKAQATGQPSQPAAQAQATGQPSQPSQPSGQGS